MRISDWSSDVCSSDLLEEEHYQCFPLEFFSVPGHLVTSLNGENLEGTFRAFIHAPFKQDEMVGDRNNTSLVLQVRSEEHTSELQSLMRISYAVFCLKKKKNEQSTTHSTNYAVIYTKHTLTKETTTTNK